MLTQIDKYLNDIKNTIDSVDRKEIENFINLMEHTRKQGKNIYIMGNGGSAGTASHFCCDFNKGVSYGKSLDKRYKCICLNDNVATMMAYANDVSYDDVFVEQLKNFLTEGDLVIGISGSGNSENVIRAINYANSMDAETISLTGFSGGILKNISKHSLHIPVNNMQIAEDLHLMMFHLSVSVLFQILKESDAKILI